MNPRTRIRRAGGWMGPLETLGRKGREVIGRGPWVYEMMARRMNEVRHQVLANWRRGDNTVSV